MARTKDPLAGIVKVLHSATCLSLSGKSNITYQIGAHPEGDVYMRINGNTGGGFFSPEWVSLQAVTELIEAAPKDTPLSSWALHPLLRGKSVNTPAFLMAALVHEKWLRILKGKKRGLEVLDAGPFQAKLEKLTATDGAGKQTTSAKAKAAMRSPAAKRKASNAKTVGKKAPAKKAVANKGSKRAVA